MERLLRSDRVVQAHARHTALRDLCAHLQIGRHQPERRAVVNGVVQTDLAADRSRKGRSLRAGREVAILGPQGDAQRRGLLDDHQGLPGDREQQLDLDAARLSRQCRRGSRARRGSRFLVPPERALQRLCQRRLYRRRICRVQERAVPARAFGRHRSAGRQSRRHARRARQLSPAVCDISGQWLPGISKWAFSYGGGV